MTNGMQLDRTAVTPNQAAMLDRASPKAGGSHGSFGLPLDNARRFPFSKETYSAGPSTPARLSGEEAHHGQALC